MKITCPKCSQCLDAPEEVFGQTLPCPSCNTNLSIPFAKPTPQVVAPPLQQPQAAAAPVSGQAQNPATPRKAPQSAKTNKTTVFAIAGGIAILLIAGVVFMFSGGLPVLKFKPPAGKVAWTFETGEGPMGKMTAGIDTSPAIGGNGVVYVVANDGKLYAVAESSGEKIWEFDAGNPINGAPALDKNGVVFFSSKKLFAIDGKTGTKLWETEGGGEFDFGAKYSTSPAIGPNGLLYVGYSDLGVEYKLVAVDSKNGKLKWEFEIGEVEGVDGIKSSPAVSSDGIVFFGGGDAVFYALDGKSGQKKWEFKTGEGTIFPGINSSPAIGKGGIVYFGSEDEKVYALDGKTGNKVWEYNAGSEVDSSPVIGPDGILYVGVGSNGLVALDGQTGKRKWSFSLGMLSFTQFNGTPIVGDNGKIYIGATSINEDAAKLYAFDGKDGVKLWEIPTGGGGMMIHGIEGGIVMNASGTLFFGALDKKLYCVGTDASGPANSPWPMFGRNARNTGNLND
ncbi:MAG: PQQ-like beta-propeller repeat protein [Verrucomicrobia bacterium]|nr:PQQ-like beta-propeller repeat protein [Verrucomicrobiota bacterium]